MGRVDGVVGGNGRGGDVTYTKRAYVMRARAIVVLPGLAAVAGALGPQTAPACHKGHQTHCVLPPPPPAPAFQCVTEMVPYTVMENRTRVEFRPVTETVMTRVPETTWINRPREICRTVFDTTTEQRQFVVCRPVYDTT